MDFNIGGDVLEAEGPFIFGFGIIVGEVVGLNCGVREEGGPGLLKDVARSFMKIAHQCSCPTGGLCCDRKTEDGSDPLIADNRRATTKPYFLPVISISIASPSEMTKSTVCASI